MRYNEKRAIERSSVAARRLVAEGVTANRVTMDKEHSKRVSRTFFDSLDDKGNYEFVCVAE
ncbi:hypothetical protein R9X49_20455 [Pectobacterium carotovorum]|uniref:hypothetical protein n=1 Tax=Pectobacterium carotovorum TaxID=554 RepID=UPI0029DA2B47|nr:hypothetical protein [Pectobacterium carotovorum]MDX6917484.1 hypothetical protein [Pectobacterium carotovorum]